MGSNEGVEQEELPEEFRRENLQRKGQVWGNLKECKN